MKAQTKRTLALIISRLNTQPALSPVNASPSLLRALPHDSGPLRLARPLTFETFIQYNLPVYPGAQEDMK